MFRIGNEPLYATEKGNPIAHLQDACEGDIIAEARKKPAWETPEKRLYAAILEDAAHEYRRVRSNQFTVYANGRKYEATSLKADVVEWINGAKATVTFAMCCEVLGFEESYIRRKFL